MEKNPCDTLFFKLYHIAPALEKIDESKKTDVISSYLDLDNPIFIEQMFIDDEISSEDEHDENVGKVDLNKNLPPAKK